MVTRATIEPAAAMAEAAESLLDRFLESVREPEGTYPFGVSREEIKGNPVITEASGAPLEAQAALVAACCGRTGPGVCDIFDFLCFQNAYAAGCP